MIRPKELLVAQEPKSLGPKAMVSGFQGRRRSEATHAGTRVAISGSWKRLMMMPSRPKTPPAAMSPLE